MPLALLPLRKVRFSRTWVDMLTGITQRPLDLFPATVNSYGAMHYISCMELFVNGDVKTCAESSSLDQFIQQLGMKGDRVAVELNREIVPRAQWDVTQLHAGDRLEIVHFVGGGADFD